MSHIWTSRRPVTDFMGLRGLPICLLVLLASSNLAHGGFIDNIQGGIKFIRDSAVNTFNDAYGGIEFAFRYMKHMREEHSDQTPSNEEEFDFIVVGSGSAGSALASRLSEVADANILLLEAGSHENYLFDIPLIALFTWLDPFTQWNYKSEPSNDYCLGFADNQCKLRTAKVMGGSSSKDDYDRWGEATGDPGWSYEGMLKYFKKLEKANLTAVEADSAYRGIDGPVDLINAPYISPIGHAFVKAGEELGFPSRDYNGEKVTSFSYVQTNQRDGERLSANRAYIYPTKDRKNLVVSMLSRVTKVIIDPQTKIAKGVEYTKRGRKLTAFAKKEVILSAGALSTPKILMLSGVGPAEHLKSFGIDVMADLPVGENLQDHTGYGGLVFLTNDTQGLIVNDFLNPANPMISEYLTEKKGPGTMAGGVEGVGFFNSDNISADDDKPNVELMFAGLGVLSTWLGHGVIFGQPENKWKKTWADHLHERAWTIWPLIMKPKSRGFVRLRSTDPKDKPKIYPCYFSDPDDIRVGIAAIHMAIKVSETQAMQKHRSQLFKRPLWGCEAHEFDSDGYWLCHMRSFTLTLWHYSGTAKMGKEDDPSAVVNPKLQLKGIKNLRVIDASIMPEIPVAHTNIPSMAIGEKGADLVKADHGYLESQ